MSAVEETSKDTPGPSGVREEPFDSPIATVSAMEEINLDRPGPSGGVTNQSSVYPALTMSAMEEEISQDTPGPSGVGEQPNKVAKPRRGGRRRTVVVGLITTVFLLAGLVLHTIGLLTPYLARLQATTSYSRLYRFPSQTDYIGDINVGLWRICSEDWQLDCIDWDSIAWDESTVGEIGKPKCLLIAQVTAVSGLVVVAIAQVMIIISIVSVCLRNPCKIRLLPIFTCIGALIGGGLVFTSCGLMAFNFDSIRDRTADVVEDATDFLKIKSRNASIAWGFYVEISSVLLVWLAGLLILCNHRGAGKVLKL